MHLCQASQALWLWIGLVSFICRFFLFDFKVWQPYGQTTRIFLFAMFLTQLLGSCLSLDIQVRPVFKKFYGHGLKNECHQMKIFLYFKTFLYKLNHVTFFQQHGL